MECAESSRLHLYFDGEIDAEAASQTQRHLNTCAQCQRELQAFEQVRDMLRTPAARLTVPAQLRGRILAALDQESLAAPAALPRRPRPRAPARPFWFGLFSGVGGSAVAAALGFFFLLPLLTSPLPSELVADHTRALSSSHLIDVVSTDQHTVKPWFAGRTDVSPEVADFAASGYKLLGGRAQLLDHQRAAVLVYQHGAHFINVYSWALHAGPVPASTMRNGYHLAFWKEGDLGYCAVSDAGWTELQTLVGLIKELGVRDAPN